MKFSIKTNRSFRKQLKKISHHSKSRELLSEVVLLLATGKKLPGRVRLHQLKGRYSGCCELHLAPDLLLIFKIHAKFEIVELIALGSHSELFG